MDIVKYHYSSMIKTIYLSNVLENFYKSYQALPAKLRQFRFLHDAAESSRALFYGNDHKAIITSFPIEEAYFKYICRLMGWQKVINLYPQTHSHSLCSDCLTDNNLRRYLVDLVKDNPGIDVIPYRATNEFYDLIGFLRQKSLHFTKISIRC